MSTLQLTIKGMHCPSCKMLIEDELEELGASNINIDMNPDTQTGIVTCENLDPKTAIKAINDLGDYKIV